MSSDSASALQNGEPSKPDPGPVPSQNAPSSSFSASRLNPGSHHRRAHSEVTFRFPDHMMDLSSSDPFNAGSFDDDDLLSTYISLDKLGDDGVGNDADHIRNGGNGDGSCEGDKTTKPNNRHSSSVDGSPYTTDQFGKIMDAKKAMPPDKLAELWTLDPKRAKRILANRQSAARSKERKANYIKELERKVHALQTEATTLSAQLTLFQRDTTNLSTENTELKLRLQAMEQQAQLGDALNEALKNEVERLKMVTGEIVSSSESFDLGMHQMSCAPTIFQRPLQPGPPDPQNMQLPPYSHLQSNLSSRAVHHSVSHHLSEIFQSDPSRQFQGLDICSKASTLVKSEGPSLSASESSTTF